jgi:hypothetical protein
MEPTIEPEIAYGFFSCNNKRRICGLIPCVGKASSKIALAQS